MQIRTKLALHLVVQVVLVALMVAALMHLAAAYSALEQSQSRRFEAHQLANELHQSSNELSLMARLYVLKPEPRYARYYAEIARIREGLAPWPQDYDATYWDLRLADPQRTESPGRPAALQHQQRPRAAALSAREQALLEEARQRSDALMRLEQQAMRLAEKRGASPRPTEWREAVDLLHGEAYLRARAEIMAPIQALTRGLAERLDAERAEARRRVNQAAWMIGATLLAFTLHALWSAYRFERSVRRPLAVLRSWAQEVRAGRHGSRTRLSLGNEFGELSAVIDEMADAVEHSLAELREEVQRRTRAEEVVQHLANHDALTGLPSLRLLHDRLERALARAQREEKGVAVLFIDLNGFKPVNDQYGHESGDMVLKVVGQRLAGAVRDADTVGRIGGDEFLVILPDVGSVEAAAQVRDKLDVLVRQPIYLPVHKLVVQVSAAMGIALYPEMAQDAASLLRLADQDMYERKAAGGGGRVAVPPIDVG
jgi:diguanylate cyclase (GGDEF)-like protein